MKHTALILSCLLALAASVCGGSSPAGPTGTTSTSTASSGSGTTTTASRSHNAGANCQNCHSFTIAGTVYKSDGTTVNPGVVVRLLSGSADNGTVVATVTTDGSGNFYSNTSVAFGSGLFASATSPTGNVRLKTTAVTRGSCNSCHTSGNRIIVD